MFSEGGIIDLFSGWPNPALLPPSIISQAAQTVLANPNLAFDALNYGPDPGSDHLRKYLATWLASFYDTPWTSAPRITITAGASQGLVSVLQVYTDPSYTKNVYMIAPAYFLACRIFEDNGFSGRLRAVPEDDEGIDIEHLAGLLANDEIANGWYDQRPTKHALPTQKHYKNVIYCVPTFSNPSGKTMSLRRREGLVRLARKYDALIITDDVYDFLHWDTNCLGKATIPRLVDIDHTLDGGVSTPFGNVVSNGTFSKILGPGLKTGWTESTPQLAEGLSKCGSSRSGGGPSHFAASVVADTMRTGALQAYIRDALVPSLRSRCEAALDAVRVHLIPHGAFLDSATPTKQAQKTIDGGYYLWVHLPPSVQSSSFAERAEAEHNVVVGGSRHFEVSGDEVAVPLGHSLRICFAGEKEDSMVEGIERLGKLLKAIMAEDVL